MKRYLLDTSILSDFLNKGHEVADRCEQERLAGNLIGTSIPVIGELFFGAFLSRDPIKSRKLIQRGTARITCWPFTIEASEVYGDIAAILKRQGNIIQHIDMQTAAIALTLGNCTVVTTDSDFSRIPGLSVETGELANFTLVPLRLASFPGAQTLVAASRVPCQTLPDEAAC